MERVKFRSVDPREKEFAAEIRKRVRAYFKENKISSYANGKMYFKTVVLLSLYIAPFVAILLFDLAPLAALGFAVLMGIGEAGIGMSVMHDGAHGAYSSKGWVNTLAGGTMFLLGSNTFNWKVQHNFMHHTYTNIYHFDADISTKAIIRLCEYAPLKKYQRFQQFYAFPLYGMMTFLRLFGEISMLVKYNRMGITMHRNAKPALELFKLITTKVVYLALIFGLPLWLSDFTFWQILLGFSTLHIVAGMIMSTVFQMAHVVEGAEQPLPDKDNVIHNDWMVHELKTTSDFGRKNGLLSWYIGGLDFQIEHHLFHNVCHVHYPFIAPIIKATAEEYGIPYNLKPNVWAALGSHFRRLKDLGVGKKATPVGVY
jgi:linoleoyl-CoA desaturase